MLNAYLGDTVIPVTTSVPLSTTDQVLVAAVTGSKIRVYQLACFGGTTAGSITFNSKPGGVGTSITPAISVAANDESVLPHSTVGWFETKVGEGLSASTGSGFAVGVLLSYIRI